MTSETNWPEVSQWSPDQLRTLWNQLQAQVNPFAQVLCLDGNLYRMLDNGAKAFIAQNFIEVRQKYKDMADRIKQALLEKHPDYQYKPRKPSEKKRRTRRNTQAQIVVSSTADDFPISSPESGIPLTASPPSTHDAN
ncbi:hypothetical protein UVI_02006020 [Ustilaginoidea virens]|uniref:Uncharacterized protein n=1 Tax=Ustilaginoidea virens TaxID=1159556 RepID=A0A1B5L7K0_USTVR|nr:hypothetical protein UVI_02006020 [Ustilaginoidea virens]